MNFSSPRVSGVTLLTMTALLAAGCASPGPPRPPSLHLPERLATVHAERQGGFVVVSFNTPTRSSDGQLLTAPVSGTLCRAVADGPCQPTQSFPGKLAVAGPVVWRDVLPRDLASGPDRLLTYRVELYTPKGRSAGPSEPAFAAAGRAPGAVEGLKADGSRRGILLRWIPEATPSGEVMLERDDAGASAQKPARLAAQKKRVGRKGHVMTTPSTPLKPEAEPPVLWLRSERAGKDAGGMVDGSARSGQPYRYTAVRSRKVTVAGKELELRSETSPAVAITLLDVFPPSVPQGVQVASFAPEGSALAADLVWEPDTEADLAGYNVYRESALAAGGYGERTKLTTALVALPAFHDATIARAVGYRYTVTAVDRKGNESAASEPAVLEPAP